MLCVTHVVHVIVIFKFYRFLLGGGGWGELGRHSVPLKDEVRCNIFSAFLVWWRNLMNHVGSI
jgi:hypothetical protein